MVSSNEYSLNTIFVDFVVELIDSRKPNLNLNILVLY